MQRTRTRLTTQQLQTFASELIGRANLAARLGQQFGGSRDLYSALGYEKKLEFSHYSAKYIRHEIARAIIDRPVKSTWQGPLELLESSKSQDTPFEKAWIDLNRKLGLKTILSRADRLTGIGRYGILFLGLDDMRTVKDFANPVKSGQRKLIYVKPFGESTVKIKKLESSPSNPRYGMPLIYSFDVDDVNGNPTVYDVHYSRVIHIVDNPLESDIYGTPRLEPIYNRLCDLEKLVGGDAEMFWRNARPGFQGKVEKDFQMTEGMRRELVEHLDEYEHDLRRFIINEGIDIEPLTQPISDPEPHFKVSISCISAQTGIPQRVLMGSERGELASTQDTSEWKDYVQSRREDFAEPAILRKFVDRLIELKILPQPSENYTVKWSDLYAMSEKEKVEVGKARANALREYTYNPIAQGIIPPSVFYEYFLGFSTEQITLTNAMRDDIISEEELANKIIETIEAETKEDASPFGQGQAGQQKEI